MNTKEKSRPPAATGSGTGGNGSFLAMRLFPVPIVSQIHAGHKQAGKFPVYLSEKKTPFPEQIELWNGVVMDE